MPTYEYACTATSCGHHFEAVQTFTEPALTVCPVCDGGLRKVFSPVGVVFKGSGFYRTDSREATGAKKRSNGSEKSDSSAPKQSSDSSSTKAESTKSEPSSSKSEGSSTTSTSDGASSSSTAKAASS